MQFMKVNPCSVLSSNMNWLLQVRIYPTIDENVNKKQSNLEYYISLYINLLYHLIILKGSVHNYSSINVVISTDLAIPS